MTADEQDRSIAEVLAEETPEFINGALPGFAGVCLQSRAQLLAIERRIPTEGRMLEIGTADGVSASLWAKHRPRASIWSLDLFVMRRRRVGTCHLMCYHLNRRRNQVLLLADSHYQPEVLARSIGQFDLVFVDGDHSEAGCASDLVLAQAVLREGGVLCVHDYGCPKQPGVAPAVDAFCASEGWHKGEMVGTLVFLDQDDDDDEEEGATGAEA